MRRCRFDQVEAAATARNAKHPANAKGFQPLRYHLCDGNLFACHHRCFL
jgi:hypothetical protein